MTTPELCILFITAEPEDRVRPDNTTELQAIREALATANVAIRKEYVDRANRRRVLDALDGFRPEIVHIICHGTPEGLMLEGDDGATSLVSAEWLTAAFARCPTVRLVVLNACNSSALAASVTTSPDTTILGTVAWNDVTITSDARRFAELFYGRLARGKRVVDAFVLAARALEEVAGRTAVIACRDPDVLGMNLLAFYVPDPAPLEQPDAQTAARAADASPRDAVDLGKGKVYFFKGDRYTRYDKQRRRTDPGYPRRIVDYWKGWPVAFDAIDAAVRVGDKVYFFQGDHYIRFDIPADVVEQLPRPIADDWHGWPPAWRSVDAAVNIDDGQLYFFRGSEYLRVDVANLQVDRPPSAIAEHWPGVFATGVESALTLGNGKVYFFKGDDYLRFDIAAFCVDPGYPLKTSVHWRGVSF